jgi:hypothetical protein
LNVGGLRRLADDLHYKVTFSLKIKIIRLG